MARDSVARWDMSAAPTSAEQHRAAAQARAQRALRGLRGTGIPLMLSLAVTVIASAGTVIGLVPDVLGVLAALGLIATVVLAIVRARLVGPFARTSSGPVALQPPAGSLVAVAVVIFIMAMIAAEGVGGHIGSTRPVSAVVTSCYVDSKGATICNGTWTYDGRTYSDELPGSGPIGSTQTVEIRPAQPGIALPASSGWLIAGIVLLVLDVALGVGWVFMLRHRATKIAASAQRALGAEPS
jgi:hypothetical protein